jgi:hypothetical protein
MKSNEAIYSLCNPTVAKKRKIFLKRNSLMPLICAELKTTSYQVMQHTFVILSSPLGEYRRMSSPLVLIYRERMNIQKALRYVPHLFSKNFFGEEKIGAGLLSVTNAVILTACEKMQKQDNFG